MIMSSMAPPAPAAIAMIFSRGSAFDAAGAGAIPSNDALDGGSVSVVVTGASGSRAAAAVGSMIEVTVLARIRRARGRRVAYDSGVTVDRRVDRLDSGQTRQEPGTARNAGAAAARIEIGRQERERPAPREHS